MILALSSAAIGLSCSGHVRFGTTNGFLDYGPGVWKPVEIVLYMDDNAITAIPLPGSFRVYEMKKIEPLREENEFQFQAELVPQSSERTTGMAVFVSYLKDGIRKVTWNAGELVGSHYERPVSYGALVCSDFAIARKKAR